MISKAMPPRQYLPDRAHASLRQLEVKGSRSVPVHGYMNFVAARAESHVVSVVSGRRTVTRHMHAHDWQAHPRTHFGGKIPVSDFNRCIFHRLAVPLHKNDHVVVGMLRSVQRIGLSPGIADHCSVRSREGLSRKHFKVDGKDARLGLLADCLGLGNAWYKQNAEREGQRHGKKTMTRNLCSHNAMLAPPSDLNKASAHFRTVPTGGWKAAAGPFNSRPARHAHAH